jgi:hypothetical protein
MTLLFADTMMEDEDLYRFLDEAATNVGAPLVRIADGRTPWQVFEDEKFIGNSRVDPCSKILKRQLLEQWMRDNCDPAETVCYVGIGWDEMHRFYGQEGRKGLKKRAAEKGWTYEAPICEPPYLDSANMQSWLVRDGITPPRLYALGFPHNNCGGFCVKAGHAHFAHLLKMLPDRYRFHEREEQRLREKLGDVSILKDRRGGETRPLTLRQFRERIEAHGQLTFDEQMEWGGCGCAID